MQPVRESIELTGESKIVQLNNEENPAFRETRRIHVDGFNMLDCHYSELEQREKYLKL